MVRNLTPYLLDVITRVAIYGTLTLGLNLAFGYTGIINLAHVAFAGIGAYAYVIAVTHGWPVVLALLASLAVTAALAATLALLVLRLRGDALALVTLFFGFVTTTILLSWQDLFSAPPLARLLPTAWRTLTRGALGIPGIPRPAWLGSDFALTVGAAAVFALTYAGVGWIARSPFGRVMAAIRDDELAAQTLGKRTAVVKVKVFVLAALVAAFGGILLTLYARYIEPGTFFLNDLVLVLTALIVGGLASRRGSVVGVAVVFTVAEALRFLPLPEEVLGPLRQIIYAATLLGILMYRPKGLLGKIAID